MTHRPLIPSRSKRRRFGAMLGMAALFMQLFMILGQALPSPAGAGKVDAAETGLVLAKATPLVICRAYGTPQEDGHDPLSQQDTCPVCLTHALGHTLMAPSGVHVAGLFLADTNVTAGPLTSDPLATFGPKRPPSHAPPSFV